MSEYRRDGREKRDERSRHGSGAPKHQQNQLQDYFGTNDRKPSKKKQEKPPEAPRSFATPPVIMAKPKPGDATTVAPPFRILSARPSAESGGMAGGVGQSPMGILKPAFPAGSGSSPVPMLVKRPVETPSISSPKPLLSPTTTPTSTTTTKPLPKLSEVILAPSPGTNPTVPSLAKQPTADGLQPPAAGTENNSYFGYAKCRLSNEYLEFSLDAAYKILSERPDFSVIGVLGTQGTGKSTILNELCGRSPFSTSEFPFPVASSNPTSQPALSPFLRPATSAAPVVAARSASGIGGGSGSGAVGQPTTTGIDLCVTSDRFILLDCQPMFYTPGTALLQPLSSHSTTTQKPTTSDPFSPSISDAAMDFQTLQLCLIMLSVCHTVLVVLDRPDDISLLRSLALALAVKKHVPSAWAPNILGALDSGAPQIQENMPEIVVVYNKAPEALFSDACVDSISTFLNSFFDGAKFTKSGSVHPHSALPSSSDQPQPVSFYLLPQHTNTTAAGSGQQDGVHRPFSDLARTLRHSVMSLRTKRIGARTLSERDWLQNVGRVVQVVKLSGAVGDYQHTVQRPQHR